MLRQSVLILAAGLICQTAVIAFVANDTGPNSPRRWKIEFLKNGKWTDAAIFDSR